MQKKISIIFFILILLLSTFVLLEQMNVTNIIPDISIAKYFIPTYSIFILIFSFVFVIFIIKLSNKKPIETVKIVYKEAENNNNINTKIEKEEEKKEDHTKTIENQVQTAIKGLSEINNIKKYSETLLQNLANPYNLAQGIVFLLDNKDKLFKIAGTYAFFSENTNIEFKIGEGITGQVAKNKQFIYIDNIPENYITILSGLGKGNPNYLIIFPIILENEVIGLVEFATFSPIKNFSEKVFTKISNIIAKDIIKIK